MGVTAGHLGGAAHGLDGAAFGGSGVVHARQLHDGARRQPVERRRHVDRGTSPGQAQYVALVDQFPEQVGGDFAEVLGVGGLLGVRRGLHHDGVPEAVAGAQRVGALGVQLGRDADLDSYEIPFEGRLQDPGHLEAADAELLRDLDLGLALEVEAAGHGRRLHQLCGSHPHG
ncbi:hypothetical protein GCM10020256_65230 [Streptomyces thermocoprophilus]